MYIQLDADYFDHPKTLKLTTLIGPEADVYPPRLWTWATKFAPKGTIDTSKLVEVACRWKGKPGALLTALRACGFIERDNRTIHNWMKRTGLDILRYEKKKERMRNSFRQSSGNLPEDSGSLPAVFSDSGTELEVTVSSGTERNGTAASPPTPPKAPKSSPIGLLLAKARSASIPGKEETLRSYLEAWKARSDYTRVEQILMDPWTRGKTVIEIQDHFWPKESIGNGALQPTMDQVLMDIRTKHKAENK